MDIEKNIENLCNEIENNSNLIVMFYSTEENYLKLNIWNDKGDLIKQVYDTKLHILNYLKGIKFGILGAKYGDVKYE
jgi:hypothetical protein